ncbi:Polyketide synthase enoylreductase [Penicillium manginii]|uniref:Polyketide synthase enoylreductase n=1 Tax=Penicillium manginii TaxID=203109 RepID=UPI002548EF5E|nr:Polyketide synthase enoylreductase [Penicillium manginii]KAJ5755499.1 Polyketide synthase enoylreductase [Penicillium manginii]
MSTGPTELPPMAEAHPESMKAWLYSGTSGGLEKNLELKYSIRAPPAPRTNEVIVKVLSAGLNPADFKVPEMGLAATHLVIGMPATPGMDFCGRVVSTGPSATHFKPGQLVYGSQSRPVKFGSLGEYLSIPATFVAPLPEGVEIDQAAGIGIAGQSAYQALLGYVKEGDKVFINGGSGGCGLFAIQIAKNMGCHVTVTCSTRNVELCYRMGADNVIDYTAEEDLVAGVKRQGVIYDHIIDHIGLPSPLYFQCHHFLKPDGVFVQVGASSMLTFAGRLAWPSILGGGKRKYVIFFFANTGQHLLKLGEMMEEGNLQTQVDSVYEFEDTVQAFEKLRSGRARGKIIVHVAKPDAHWHQEMGLF